MAIYDSPDAGEDELLSVTVELEGLGDDEVAPEPEPTPQRAPGGPRVLVVDDEEEIRNLLSTALLRAEYQVETAGRGLEALHKIKSFEPEVILLDAMLPEVHGFEIRRKVRASKRFAHVPVVMISAVYRGWRYAQDLKEVYGATDFIEKPFRIPDVLKRVEDALKGADAAPPEAPAEARDRATRAYRRGVGMLKVGRIDGAIEAFREGIAADPFAAALHFSLGRAQQLKGEGYGAMASYERAVELKPDLFAALKRLAELYEQKGFRRKAIEAWERALPVAPDDAGKQLSRQSLLALLETHEVQLRQLRPALRHLRREGAGQGPQDPLSQVQPRDRGAWGRGGGGRQGPGGQAPGVPGAGPGPARQKPAPEATPARPRRSREAPALDLEPQEEADRTRMMPASSLQDALAASREPDDDEAPPERDEKTTMMSLADLDRAREAAGAPGRGRGDEGDGDEDEGWYAVIAGKQQGPFDDADFDAKVAAGKITERTYVWREGMDDWRPAKAVPILAARFAPATTPLRSQRRITPSTPSPSPWVRWPPRTPRRRAGPARPGSRRRTTPPMRRGRPPHRRRRPRRPLRGHPRGGPRRRPGGRGERPG